MGLHSTLLRLLGFARNDIPDRSFNRIGVPPALQLSSLSQVAHALPVARCCESPKQLRTVLKSSTERGPLSFSSVRPPWVIRDRVVPAASPAMSAALKAEVNSEHL
jgi:hypothetical protein